MNIPNIHRNTPGLLVSVRNATEAVAALDGGANVIDVKEPDRGPLGAADPETIAEIVSIVSGRTPVTAAAGEILDVGEWGAARTIESLPPGVILCKAGLYGCRELSGWERLWYNAAAQCRGVADLRGLVAVVYADWQAARSPRPMEVLQIAAELHCPALLIDTWDKSAGDLFANWSVNELDQFIRHARNHQMAVVLAGSLNGSSLAAAAHLAPDLVAVRGAACADGRTGTVTAERVAALKELITAARLQSSTLTPACN